jgi:hypothetical protein
MDMDHTFTPEAMRGCGIAEVNEKKERGGGRESMRSRGIAEVRKERVGCFYFE